MRSELEAYLHEHGARYTPEALRKALLDAGYDPVEVDAAIAEWQTGAAIAEWQTGAATAAREPPRGRFWRWTFGLHAAVLVLLAGLSAASGGLAGSGSVALAILAGVLIVGIAISGAIGRTVLAGGRMAVALIAPALSAVAIGGSCLAFGGSLLFQRPPPPQTSGVMTLEIESPTAFTGSGAATCQAYRDATGFSVFAEDLGALGSSRVSVSLESFAPSDVEPAPAPGPGEEASYSLLISLMPQSEGDPPIEYANAPTSRVAFDASPDGLVGSATFEGLEAMVEVPPATERPEPITGRITWSCE